MMHFYQIRCAECGSVVALTLKQSDRPENILCEYCAGSIMRLARALKIETVTENFVFAARTEERIKQKKFRWYHNILEFYFDVQTGAVNDVLETLASGKVNEADQKPGQT